MSIQRAKLSKELLGVLCEKYSPSYRFSDFDINKVYIDYTKEEKEKSRDVSSVISNNIVPNEFFICYTYKDELFFLVSGDDDYTDDNIIKHQSDIIDLFIMQHEKSLRVNKSLSSNEFYNALYTYEEAEYTGHTYTDLVDFIEPFSLYKIDNNSRLLRNGTCAYAYYRLCEARNSDFPWEKDTLNEIESVIFAESVNIPYHNILNSLSSRQWTHIFLESYKMIEHLFSVVFLSDLDEETEIETAKLAYIIEKNLKWRAPEDKSIERIFNEISDEFSDSELYRKIEKIKKKKVQDMRLDNWYYTEIRNQIAHFRIIHQNIEFSNKEWNTIIRFNFMIVKYLYEKYDRYLALENLRR